MNAFDFNKRYLPTGTTLDILNLETREKEYWSLYNNQLSKDIETWYSDKNKESFTKLTPIEKKEFADLYFNGKRYYNPNNKSYMFIKTIIDGNDITYNYLVTKEFTIDELKKFKNTSRSFKEFEEEPYIISIPNSWVNNGESYPIETYWIK